MGEWDEFSAFAAARQMVAQDPSLVNAIMRGVMAGHEDAAKKLREELSWSNMAMDAALMLLTKRGSPALNAHLEFCIRKRLEVWGAWQNQAEKEFLSATAPVGDAK